MNHPVQPPSVQTELYLSHRGVTKGKHVQVDCLGARRTLQVRNAWPSEAG